MDDLNFKKTQDENELFAEDLFSKILPEAGDETSKKKASLYGVFGGVAAEKKDSNTEPADENIQDEILKAAEVGKTQEAKTAERDNDSKVSALIHETEPLELDVSAAVDEKKKADNSLVYTILTAVIILLALICGFLLGKIVYGGKGSTVKAKTSLVDFKEEGLDKNETAKFQSVYRFILDNYYDEVDPNTLIEGAIKGMSDSLGDPYGGYKTKENMTSYNDYIEGKNSEGEKKPSVTSEMLDNGVKYVKINQFVGGTADEFKAALEKDSKGTKGVIIDLRGNPGGYADESIAVADMILKEGVIATSRDRDGKIVRTEKSDENGLSVPVVLLVNGGTASAAELVTGAVRDFKAGEIVGERTYGKALAQITKNFEYDGTGIVLSAYTYFTPSGECIDKVGIEPTVKLSDDPETAEDEQLLEAVRIITEA